MRPRREGLMTKRFVFDPPTPPTVALVGEPRRFPVRRIFCVGATTLGTPARSGKASTNRKTGSDLVFGYGVASI